MNVLRPTQVASVGLCLALALGPLGCSETSNHAPGDAAVDAGDVSRTERGDGGSGGDGGPQSEGEGESCAEQQDGTPCSGTRHCVGGQCLHNFCGDGVAAEDEVCDDGNETPGDGCDPSCQLSPGPSCGDGERDPGEECDDGNLRETDACSTGCTRNACGNGRRDPGEECDDGDGDDLDYCTTDCLRNVCRNGRLDPGEECDDGNNVTDDGCTNFCRAIVCGDGKRETEAGGLIEECDDGNDIDDDACSNVCTRNECGNGRVDPGEVCEAGQLSDDALQVCNDTCDGYEDAACGQCMAEHCNDYQGSGIDLQTGCRENADVYTEDGANPSRSVPPNFVERCTALDQCVVRNDCGVLSGIHPCYCGDDFTACQNEDQLEGPCVAEAMAASGVGDDSCELRSGPKAPCLVDRTTDLTLAMGWSNFLSICRLEACACECQVGDTSACESVE